MIVKPVDARVAVVTINFNGEKDTLRLLDRLNSMPERVAVVVVDNNSDEYPEKLKKKFPLIDLVSSQLNIGFGKGNNLGVSHLVDQGYLPEFVYILNNDTEPDDSSISVLESFLDDHPDVHCAAPLILYPDRSTIWFAGGGFSLRNVGATSPYKDKPVSVIEDMSIVVESPFISGCAMFMRSKHYIEYGGFDPRFFMYIEDVDFSYRISRKAKCVVALSSIVVHHAHSSIGVSGDIPLSRSNPRLSFYIENVVFGSKLFLKKNYKGLLFFAWYTALFLKWQRNGLRLGVSAYMTVVKTWFSRISMF